MSSKSLNNKNNNLANEQKIHLDNNVDSKQSDLVSSTKQSIFKPYRKYFDKVLIANRSDIAVRIIVACKELGIKTVAVHSTADNNALHVKLADESVCIGDGPSTSSYLNMKQIIAAAEITNAQAIHPGLGFLSENDQFAAMVVEHGLTFIGPTAKNILEFGSKITARQIMEQYGVAVIPGRSLALDTLEDAKKAAKEVGYPFVFKGAWCGGGKGIRIVREEKDLEEAYNMARMESEKIFNKLDIYIEKYLTNSRHIEMQICADKHGNVIHLGERDCSLQRNHQKIWEEAPSTVLNPEYRERLGQQICHVMREVKYEGVGTVEFLYDLDTQECYFMEMNTRLQVEHTITEEITGIDLVRLQLLVAAGDKLHIKQEDVKIKGHAIECRINAENSETFTPSIKPIDQYLPPSGKGIRVESAAYTGFKMPMYYDSLLSKLIVYDETRELAIQRMKHALKRYVISGPDTLIPLHLRLCDNKDVIESDFNTMWLSKFLAPKK